MQQQQQCCWNTQQGLLLVRGVLLLGAVVAVLQGVSTGTCTSASSSFCLWRDLNIVRNLETTILLDEILKQSSSSLGVVSDKPNDAKYSRLEQQHEPTSPYAYTFVMGGVNPEQPSYRGILWGVMVCVYALQSYGSTADFVLFIQLAENVTLARRDDDGSGNTFGLTATELRVLRDLRVHCRYIPNTAPSRNFHDIIMNKFAILTLTEYQRVFFLDADLVVFQNLDYLFAHEALKANFYVATSGEPANAGFFILSPKPGDYERVLEIIAHQKESAARLTNAAKFDKTVGWGHEIEAPDYWETTHTRGTQWSFYCAPSDQGLLFYWTKYVQHDVSIMVKHSLKNWGAFPNGTVKVDVVLSNPFASYTNRTIKNNYCKRFMCVSPMRDYEHLAGPYKPWIQDIPQGAFGENRTKGALEYWFYLFYQLDQTYNIGVNFDNWQQERDMVKTPPLGFKPPYYNPKCRGCNFD